MATSLRRQDRDGRAMVAAQHRQESALRDPGQPICGRLPPPFDVAVEVEVAEVMDAEAGQQLARLSDRRHHS
jgi:hypothetical protein